MLALVTPQGPAGSPAQRSMPMLPFSLSGDFDPFARNQAGGGSAIVTALPIKLHGTRLDGATGRGFAIIATPDGVQSSFAVGEIIMPGVKLWSVARDEVTIDRGGARERLFLDQSQTASLPGLGLSASQPPALPATPPINEASISGGNVIAPSSGEIVPAMPAAPVAIESVP